MFDFKILKQIVEDSGFKQSHVARKTNISEKNLSLILNGKMVPPLNAYIELCNFFNISFDECIKTTHKPAS